MRFNLNAQIYIVVDEQRFEHLQKNGLSKALGYWLWNMAVMIAPYDTGNLRSSIYLAKNNKNNIRINYDLSKAQYALFLEMGVGPVTKYEGYIRFQTTSAVLEQTVAWLKTGKEPSYIAINPKPFVQLRESKHEPFSWERKFLRQANMNVASISGKTRGKISQIRAAQSTHAIQSTRGQRVQTKNAPGMRSVNRNISQLNNIYKERVEALRKSDGDV